VKRFTKAILITLASLAILATAVISVYSLQGRTQANDANVAAAQTQAPTTAELLKLVNEERAKNGASPLIEDSRIDASAQRKADDMLKYDYFAHVSPHDGKQGYTYINDSAPGLCKYGSENLAWNADKSQITSAEAVSWWISSKPHHEAMIDKKYTLTGFGITKDAVVEHFCEQ